MTKFPDFRRPDGGFAGPVSLWLASHQRLDEVCALLRRLRRHIEDLGTDEASRFGAEGVRLYFNEVAARHHDDEDLDLFPRVLENLSGRRRATARSVIDRLHDDHLVAPRLWQPVDEQLAEVQRGARRRIDEGAVEALIDKHLTHRDAEESALLELVRTTLQPADLAAIGAAMAKRRGLSWADLNGSRPLAA